MRAGRVDGDTLDDREVREVVAGQSLKLAKAGR